MPRLSELLPASLLPLVLWEVGEQLRTRRVTLQHSGLSNWSEEPDTVLNKYAKKKRTHENTVKVGRLRFWEAGIPWRITGV